MTALAPVPVSAFTAALGSAAEVAARCPSSHNCQPWGLAALVTSQAQTTIGGQSREPGTRTYPYLVLALDTDKSLRALHAHRVEMVLSCGMYWELLTGALAALGWAVTTTWYADDPAAPSASAVSGRGICLPGGWPRTWAPLAAGTAEPSPADPVAFASLRRLVSQRRTNRGGYRPDAGAALGRLAHDYAADGTVADAGVRVRHLLDPAERTAVARLVARHGGRDFAHVGAWRETHSFIRRDTTDAERHGDGFTLEQLLGPMSWPKELLTRAALAPGTMRALRVVGYPRLLAARLAQAVTRSPGLVVIATEHGSPGTVDLLRAGSAIVRYWLAATGYGLALHPVSIVLQHDDVRQRLESALGVPGRAVFLARVGEPLTQVPPTPRHAPAASWRTF